MVDTAAAETAYGVKAEVCAWVWVLCPSTAEDYRAYCKGYNGVAGCVFVLITAGYVKGCVNNLIAGLMSAKLAMCTFHTDLTLQHTRDERGFALYVAAWTVCTL